MTYRNRIQSMPESNSETQRLNEFVIQTDASLKRGNARQRFVLAFGSLEFPVLVAGLARRC